jgi:hypothetical protein
MSERKSKPKVPERTRRLRLTKVLVRPILEWDDGEELTPGPQCEMNELPPSQVSKLLAELKAQIPALEAQAEAQSADGA